MEEKRDNQTSSAVMNRVIRCVENVIRGNLRLSFEGLITLIAFALLKREAKEKGH